MKRRTIPQMDALKERMHAAIARELAGLNRDSRLAQIGRRMTVVARVWNRQMNHFHGLPLRTYVAPDAAEVRHRFQVSLNNQAAVNCINAAYRGA